MWQFIKSLIQKIMAFIGKFIYPSPPVGGGAFSPTDVAGLTVWLKADAITGLSDADPVTTWVDSSGNGNDATQATASKKPIYKTSIINGKPIVRFDGTDDYVRTGAFTATATAKTIFCVFNSDVDIWTYISDGQSHNRGCFLTEPGKLTYHAGGGQISRTTSAHVGAFVYATIVDNGASSSVNHNGGTPTTGTVNSATYTAATVGTGGAEGTDEPFFNGDVAEWLLYDGALSAGDISSVEGYLADKYAL